MKKNIISLKNIQKTFSGRGNSTQALASASLEIHEGDYVSISGPSGSGKSTLLTILGLLDKPDDGEYLLAGVDVKKLDYDQLADLRNQHIGFVFQAFNLIEELSVTENVSLPLQYREPSLSASEVAQKVKDILTQLGLDNRAEHRPSELSGGQQQRVAVARALVGSPSILLVDEPTGNLDSKNGEMVMDVLDELNANGTTILIVTHEPKYAARARSHHEILDGVLSTVTSHVPSVEDVQAEAV